MKKTLTATLVAALLGVATSSSAVEVYNVDNTILDVYGNLQFALSSTQRADGDGGADAQEELADNGSTIGFRGEHEVSSALTTYFAYEFEGDADEIKNGSGIDTGDKAYIGLKGDFGDARLGSWDPLIDDWIQDPISNNEFFDVSDSNSSIGGSDGLNTQGLVDAGSPDREGDKLQYLSAPIAGLQLGLGLQFKGQAEDENIDDSAAAAFFAGVEYAVGPVTAAFVYDSLDLYDGSTSGRQFLDANGAPAGEFDAGDQFGLTVQYELAQLTMAAKYERFESGDDDFVADVDRYALSVRYAYGAGDLYGAYQLVDVGESGFADTFVGAGGGAPEDGSDETFNEFVVGATYAISENVYTFAEAAAYDQEDDVGDGVAVGAAYLF